MKFLYSLLMCFYFLTVFAFGDSSALAQQNKGNLEGVWRGSNDTFRWFAVMRNKIYRQQAVSIVSGGNNALPPLEGQYTYDHSPPDRGKMTTHDSGGKDELAVLWLTPNKIKTTTLSSDNPEAVGKEYILSRFTGQPIAATKFFHEREEHDGKVLRLMGTISRTKVVSNQNKRDRTRHGWVHLEAKISIECLFEDASLMQSLKQGQQVVIEGVYDRRRNKLCLCVLIEAEKGKQSAYNK
jgi:hypothetical protein